MPRIWCKTCRWNSSCGEQQELMQRLFFAFGSGLPVECADFKDAGYHGVEGVTA